MKKKFSSGVVAGVMISMLVFTVFFSFYLKKVEQKEENNSGVVSGQQLDNTSNQSEPKSELNKKVNYIKRLIDRYYMGEVTEEDYETWYLRSILYALDDPYSCYYTPQEYNELMESSNGTYCGIGALVSQNVKTGVITIVKPFVNGPAYEAGMLPGDIIYKVEGKEVTGVDISQVVSEMKGEKGTKVEVEVVREGEKSPLCHEYFFPLVYSNKQLSFLQHFHHIAELQIVQFPFQNSVFLQLLLFHNPELHQQKFHNLFLFFFLWLFFEKQTRNNITIDIRTFFLPLSTDMISSFFRRNNQIEINNCQSTF